MSKYLKHKIWLLLQRSSTSHLRYKKHSSDSCSQLKTQNYSQKGPTQVPPARLCEKWELMSIPESIHYRTLCQHFLRGAAIREKMPSQHKARHVSGTVAACAAGGNLCAVGHKQAGARRVAHMETAPLASQLPCRTRCTKRSAFPGSGKARGERRPRVGARATQPAAWAGNSGDAGQDEGRDARHSRCPGPSPRIEGGQWRNVPTVDASCFVHLAAQVSVHSARYVLLSPVITAER